MKKIIITALLLAQSQASAIELKSNQAKALAEELKYSINSTISKIVELEKQSNGGQDVSFDLTQTSKQTQSLGLLVKPGGKILAVTPNSLADALGFKSGDLIKQISADSIAFDVKKPYDLKAGSNLEAIVERGGQALTLAGVVSKQNHNWNLSVQESSSDADAAMAGENSSACARLSIFSRPPETKDYYDVSFNRLNDKNVNRGREVIRVKPGKHIVKLNEHIFARGLRIRRPNIVRGKVIEINVEPNKTYHLAAAFDRTKRLESKGEPYWEPIVWKVSEKNCEF